jgi:hypothetical protein
VITVGGGAAVIAYGTFTWLGKKWLEGKFAERLEAFKHQQDLQLEQYRYEINALFSRVTKIHEKEFEVLPTAWSKLQDGLGRVAQFTSPLQTYPDLNHMNEAQVEESLAKSDLTESQKEEIRHAVDKNQAYIKTIFWYDLNDAKKYVADFHNYLLYNKIFLSRALFESFTKFDKMLSNALEEREIMERSRNYIPASKTFMKVRDEVLSTIEDLETQIQQRLHYTEAK